MKSVSVSHGSSDLGYFQIVRGELSVDFVFVSDVNEEKMAQNYVVAIENQSSHALYQPHGAFVSSHSRCWTFLTAKMMHWTMIT